MTDLNDNLIMRLFVTPEGNLVALDLRAVTGVIQECGPTLKLYFGEHSILILDEFDRVWELVDEAKRWEAAK